MSRSKKRRKSGGLIVKLKQEADELEARIKQMAEMAEKGFYLCENGHEFAEPTFACSKCEPLQGKAVPVKYVKRDLMTGQEKYDSDKQRKEVETMIANKRQLSDQYDADAKGGDDTAKHFRKQAASSRQEIEPEQLKKFALVKVVIEAICDPDDLKKITEQIKELSNPRD